MGAVNGRDEHLQPWVRSLAANPIALGLKLADKACLLHKRVRLQGLLLQSRGTLSPHALLMVTVFHR